MSTAMTSISHAEIPPVALNGRVLIVDDDATVREGMKKLLESIGIDVITHDSVITLPLVMRATRPDVLLLDVDMPALSGVSFLRMKEQPAFVNAGASVILFSGLPAVHLADLAESFGAEFILKCEEPQRIGERVLSAVGERRMRRATQAC